MVKEIKAENFETEVLVEALIKDKIQKALLKRGIIVDLSVSFETNKHDKKIINVSSSKFQTYPVLFKSIEICDFGSSVKFFADDENEKVKFAKFWIAVNIGYTHFDMGSNGCKLFDINGEFTLDEHPSLFNVVIN